MKNLLIKIKNQKKRRKKRKKNKKRIIVFKI